MKPTTDTDSPTPRRRIKRFRLLFVVILTIAIAALYLGYGHDTDGFSRHATPLRIGHVGGPLLGPLYAVADIENAPRLELARFSSSSDIGYALLSGHLDAGFIETDKALALLEVATNAGLKVAGAIEFPYGATLVVRKDLSLRLSDLTGRTIAARDRHCALLHQFEQDMTRHGLDPVLLNLIFLPFADLVPALEAKVIDGALLKGAHALIAESQGHKVLYQNCETAPGDDCCPATLAQAEFLLIVRAHGARNIAALVDSLEVAGELPPALIRQAIAANTGYPAQNLEHFPTPWFSRVSEELEKQLGEAAWCEKGDGHDH